jgi:hypothetical protein
MIATTGSSIAWLKAGKAMEGDGPVFLCRLPNVKWQLERGRQK